MNPALILIGAFCALVGAEMISTGLGKKRAKTIDGEATVLHNPPDHDQKPTANDSGDGDSNGNRDAASGQPGLGLDSETTE